jgi:hypothetical protein
MPAGQPLDLLGERPNRTVRLVAEQPTSPHLDHDRLTTYRGIRQAAPVPAVHPHRLGPAPRTPPADRTRPHPDTDPARQPLDVLDHHAIQMRQQQTNTIKIT